VRTGARAVQMIYAGQSSSEALVGAG